MNTGIIDPGYSGKISTLLINFGKNPKSISKGKVVLRVTFANVSEKDNPQATPIFVDDDTYLKRIKESTDNFDETFLNISAILENVNKKWWNIFWNRMKIYIPTLIAILSLIVSIFLYYYTIKNNK
jgi:hypothetical protein